jgi:hypothetical protein
MPRGPFKVKLLPGQLDHASPQHFTDSVLRLLATTINGVLQWATGGRLAFALVVFTEHDTARTSYIGNASRAQMASALIETGQRLRAGLTDGPGGTPPPRAN